MSRKICISNFPVGSMIDLPLKLCALVGTRTLLPGRLNNPYPFPWCCFGTFGAHYDTL